MLKMTLTYIPNMIKMIITKPFENIKVIKEEDNEEDR